MKAGICSVGTELAGHPTGADATWLARRLAEVGARVAATVAVGDDHATIVDALRWLVERCDAVVVASGPGPTPNDLTRAAVAEMAGVALESGPKGFTVEVTLGANRPCVLYALPGDTDELRAMAERDVLPDLVRRGASGAPATPTVHVTGPGQSAVAETVAQDVTEAAEEQIEEQVARLLRLTGLTVATAESCTAGGVAARLARVPGASDYLRGGLVAYTTDVKSDVLGVPRTVLEEHGPVAAATSEAMARRARELFGADLGVAVTCVAGPATQGGRPVGTVIWALAADDVDVDCREVHLPGDRATVGRRATSAVLHAVRRHLAQRAGA